MSKKLRVYYDKTAKRYLICGDQRKAYTDEIEILVTPSEKLAIKVRDILNKVLKENSK